MPICCSPNEDEGLPFSCTISITDEAEPMDGTIWAFYPHRCLLESGRGLTLGMGVSQTLDLSEIARVRLGPGIVTWVCDKACGIEFPHSSASTTFERLPCAGEVSAVDHAHVSRVHLCPTLPAD